VIARPLILTLICLLLAACGPPRGGPPAAGSRASTAAPIQAAAPREEARPVAHTQWLTRSSLVLRPRSAAAFTAARGADTPERAEEDESQALVAQIEGAERSEERRAAIDRYAEGPADSSAEGDEPLLRSLNTDPDPVVRRWAALALERRASPALASALRQAHAAEPDRAVRAILARALRRAEGAR